MRIAVIEIGGSTTRAVVADTAPDGGLRTCLDRRIVLRLQHAIDRNGRIGDGLRLLVAETVRRLQAECFRAGAARPSVSVEAALTGAADLADLLTSLDQAGAGPVRVRSRFDEARLMLRTVGGPQTAAVVVADVGERVTRFVRRDHGGVRVEVRPGPIPTPGMCEGVSPDRDGLLAGLGPLEEHVPVIIGPIPATVVRALWARDGRGLRPPDVCEVTREAFGALARELHALSPTQRLLLPALAPEDVDTVAIGAGYLERLLAEWAVDRARVTSASVIEAELNETLSARRSPSAAATTQARV